MKLEKTTADNNVFVYDENIWTGRRSLAVNGEQCLRIARNRFQLKKNEGIINITIMGTFLAGITLVFDDGRKEILCKNKWYEWILIFVPLLSFAIGIFCGAIGGALSAGFAVVGAFINATMLRTKTNLAVKIVVCILSLLITFAIWFGIYLLIVGGIAAAFPNLFG